MVVQSQSAPHRSFPWRILGWGLVGLLLVLPYVAGAPWTAFDYVVAAILLGTVGLAFELIARRSRSLAYRAGAALAVMAGFLTLWINGAVGMIGSEDDAYNLLFLGIVLLAAAGATFVRFRAAGMGRVMLAAAAAQVALGLWGLTMDPRGGIFSTFFAVTWLISAGLFRIAADEKDASDPADRRPTAQ